MTTRRDFLKTAALTVVTPQLTFGNTKLLDEVYVHPGTAEALSVSIANKAHLLTDMLWFSNDLTIRLFRDKAFFFIRNCTLLQADKHYLYHFLKRIGNNTTDSLYIDFTAKNNYLQFVIKNYSCFCGHILEHYRWQLSQARNSNTQKITPLLQILPLHCKLKDISVYESNTIPQLDGTFYSHKKHKVELIPALQKHFLPE